MKTKIKKHISYKIFSTFFLLVLIVGILFSTNIVQKVYAANFIDQTFSYQGRLTDNIGSPVTDGSHDFCFSIWTASSGGSKFWPVGASTPMAATTSSGVFDVVIGSGADDLTTLDVTANSTLYLQVEARILAGGTCQNTTYFEVLSPRQRISSSAFARAAYKVINGTFTTPITVNNGAVTLSGNASGSTLTLGAGAFGLTGAASKNLTFNNSLTLSGTDGTTMTFPGTSKTIAANDGSNWTLASQAAGDLLVASSTTAYGRLAKGGANQVLAMDGAGTNLGWTAAAAGDMTLAGAQTVSGAKTFNTSTLKQFDPTGTYSYTIVPASIVANRNLTLPLLGGNDTLAALGMTQTFTGVNTMSGANVITHGNAGLLVYNPGGNYTVQITPSAEVASRVLTIPLLGGNDTMMTLGTAQSVTGQKTFTAPVLGVATATSINTVTISGSSTPTLAVTGTSSISGANTGDNSANTTYASDYRVGNFIAGTNYVAPGAYASTNGHTMSTARLLGRTTASTGAAEEISVAGSLTLSGGVLTGTGGSGTVTATGGALTSNGVILGAGTTDTKVSTGINTNGASQLILGLNASTLGTLKMFGNTSGDVTLQPTAAAGTGTVLTMPATTGTIALTSQIPTVGTWGALNYPTWSSGSPLVKMTAAGTFGLDTTAYVTGVSVATANGVSGSSGGGATPTLTISLGAITPTSVNGVTLSGSSTPTLAVTGTTTVSGANTGDQTKIANLIGGNNTTLLGSIPYQSNTDTTTLLAPNTTAGIKYLSMTGTGTNGAAPVWTTLAGGGTVTGVSTAAANNGVTATWSMASPTPALTIGLGAITPTSVNGLTLAAAGTGFSIAGGTTSKTLTMNNTLAFSGTDGTTMTFPAVNSTLAENDGGNWTFPSQAQGDLLVAANGTSYQRLAKGTMNQVLTMDGTGANVTWATPAGGGAPGGNSREIQYNTGSGFGGATNLDVTTEGNLQFTAITQGTTPPPAAAGTVTMFGRNVGGRLLAAIIGPSGQDTSLQPHIGRNKISLWSAAGNGTVITAVGATALTATGTPTSASTAITNMQTRIKRITYQVTTAATTAVVGFRGAANQYFFGNAAKSGGFHFICQWGPATGVTTTTNRAFVGMSTNAAAPTDVQPSSLVTMAGMGWDAADVNVQFMSNDASGTATKVDLGASFPVSIVNNTDMYELIMFAAPNSATLNWQVTNLTNDVVRFGTVTVAGDLPAVNILLSPRGYMSVGGTSSVIGIALAQLYIETDY